MPQYTFRLKNGELARKGLERLRKKIPIVGRARIWESMQAIVKYMRKPGKPPPKHINWDSQRQRIAYFASDGFGRGIPTVRTDHYISGWKAVKAGPNGYMVLNDVSYSKYLGGLQDSTGQSRIHAGRWPLFRDVLERVLARLPKTIQRNMKALLPRGENWQAQDEDPTGGVE